MIKTVFAVLFSFLVCFQAAFAVVTRKKFSSGKQQYYIYYDGNGQEIAREKTVKNQPSVFSPGADINGEVRELGPKGELVYVWNYKNNKKEGKAFGYYPGGGKMYELNYSGGLLQGIGIKYLENGKVSEKVFYVDGKVEGPAHIYLENGNYYKYNYEKNKLEGQAYLYDTQHRLLETATYGNNVLEGAYIKYYLSGAVKSEMTYRRGKIEGYARYYDEKGREVSTRLYRNGREIDKIEHIDEESKVFSPKTAFLKRKDSESIVWQGPAAIHLRDSGKMIGEIKFFEKDKKLNGEHKTYYKNGQVKYEGRFVNGIPSGKFKTYSPDGRLLGTDNYYRGKLSGISTMYYSSGEKLAEYRYKNGKLEGVSSVYSKYGSLILEASYRNNMLHGSIKNFYESGLLCFESYFSNGEPVGQLRYYFPTKEHKLMYLLEFKNGKIHKSAAFSEDEFVEFIAEY